MSDREELSWELFGTAARELTSDIGGLFVAGALGYALDVKSVHLMNIEFYTGVDERLEMPVMLPPVPNTVDISGARVLIADDVADTGEMLRLVRDFCAEHVAEAHCAVIYQKPQSTLDCEYVWRRIDRWIEFPWSVLPPIVNHA